MASTYTAANVALEMVGDLSGIFSDLDRRFRGYTPPPVRPTVEPDVDTSQAERDLGPNGEAGSGLVAAAAAVGIAAGAAIALGLGDALEREALGDKLAAQLGGDPKFAADAGRIAGQLYAEAYGESLADVNDAIRAVLQSGALSEDATDGEIKKITGSVLDLAQAFGVDAAGAANALGQMMRTGMAPDAETALDIVTRGFQQGADKSEDFLDTLNEYSTQFRKLGLDGATATGLIVQGVRAGARDSDLAADALKEFSIRAVDGSTAAADAYKALGLDAAAMTAQMARGGTDAAAGLDIVLDRLRGMTDPVERNAAAVGLFGTQAEDLGEALFALDPSSAVDGLGQVAGAATEMGTVLADNASTRIESFKRTMMDGLVNIIGGTVIPVLTSLIDVGKLLFGWGPVPEILQFLLVSGSAVAGVVLVVVGAIKAWAAAQALLNIVLTANPIGIVVAAVAGLVAGLIWAYHNVEWFREGVDGAFRVIGDVATWLWQNVFVPAWEGISNGLRIAWAIIEPILNVIGTILRVLGAIIFVVLVAPWLIAFNLLSTVVGFFWNSVLKPVFDAIAFAANFLWVNALKPVFDAISLGWQVLMLAFQIYWQTILKPLFDAVGTGASFLWTNALKPVFDLIEAGWELLMTGLDAVYNAVLKPLFSTIDTATKEVAAAFEWAVNKIGEVWGFLRDKLRPPVEFVVNAVYNGGIRPAWNFIAGLFNLGTLPELHFAKGGVLPGYAPGRDTIPAMLSPGEGILVPEAVRMLGPETILAINKMARGGRLRKNGQPAGGDIGYLGDYKNGRWHYAEGGIAGWLWDKVGQVGSFVGGIADFLTDPTKAVRAAFSGINTGPLGGLGRFSEALLAIPEKAITGAIDKVKSILDSVAPSGGMAGVGGAAAALAWAYSQAGKPYQWGGGGNPSWDCSGFMAGITRVIRGQTPGRIGTTQTMPWNGFVRNIPSVFMIGNTRNAGGGIGHMAGTLLGVPVESSGGAGVRVGNGRGAFSSLFPEHYGMLFDDGGWLPPGLNLTMNATGRPEPIFTNDQWRMMREGIGGGSTTIIQAREPFSGAELRRLAKETDRQHEWRKRQGVG